MLELEVEDLESLKKDIEQQVAKIEHIIPKALSVVGDELVASLQKHVKKDVYEAYKPKVYKRSGAMVNPENMGVYIKGNTLHFEYSFNTESAEPYFTDSDDVIAAIQDSSYLWNVGDMNIPERPFWDEFYMEEFGDGKVDSALARGINRYAPELKARAKQGSIIFDGKDSNDLHGSELRGTIVFPRVKK